MQLDNLLGNNYGLCQKKKMMIILSFPLSNRISCLIKHRAFAQKSEKLDLISKAS
jgi:hypothetical protein